ncbi:hypothetical protein LWI29_016761 [Acer saccharum]|uniref:Uncharacterized protein n=1 Tax=Acer saccharum TaxID=4024 RepID=A0AA39SYH3_ACESA|nr:hypothetical protein LWI29_016761 [Acer saccharum]
MGKARAKKTTPAAKRSVGLGSQNQGECVRNCDYSGRMARLNATQFIFERAIYLDELRHTKVSEIVVQRGWGDFVKALGISNATLVKEFYVSMDSEKLKKGGAVLVRDMEVGITAWMGIAIKTKGKKRQRIRRGESNAAGSSPEDTDAEFDFDCAELGFDEDEDYEGVSGGSKLDQVLSTVKEIKERTEMRHKRMDLFEAKLQH